MVTERIAWSDLPIPPGELLEEELEAAGMTQQELAIRTGRPAQVISEIVRGKKAITHDTAIELEKVLGVPAHIWVGLEAEYQLVKARLRDQLESEKQQDWLAQFPVKELEKRGWIPKSRNANDAVQALLHFLGVASFSAWRQTAAATSFRITPGSRVSDAALSCWLRQGERIGFELDLPGYNEGIFLHSLDKIRSLTIEEPGVFGTRLSNLCADAGVALVIVPELPKSGANGAARWLGGRKPLIQLSLRYRWSDHFWFTFFHESCHILKHKTKEIHIDGLDGEDAAEVEANAFAANFLISSSEWAYYTRTKDFTRDTIREFAARNDINPAVVVGRLQHERFIGFNMFNDIRPRFVWAD